MTLWESLYCDKCNEEMKEVKRISTDETLYECPKCGCRVRLILSEDYDD